MKYLSGILLILLAIILCLRQSGEPDIYWQLKTGYHILENGTVPDTDIFSFTHAGNPWVNVKWLTEVIMALVDKALGIPGMMVLQALVLLITMWLLYRSAMAWQKSFDNKSHATWVALALFLFLFIVSYRLNGRPEMMSHIFCALFLFIMTRNYFRPSWHILWLFPIQVLWANMHEGYGVGLVMILIFVFSYHVEASGLLITRGFRPLQHERNSKINLALLALLAPALHPMGISMIWYPLNIFGQLSQNQFTTELWSFQTATYWTFPAFLLIIIAGLLVYYLQKKNSAGLTGLKNLPLWYLVLLAAFFYLALASFRNIVFFAIISFPALVLAFKAIIVKEKHIYPLVIVLSVIGYVAVGSGVFYNNLLEREAYGLRINPTRNAIGTTQFIKDNKLQGKAYVGYLSSSILLYHIPEYKSYIDLRDLDVFEKKFMENVLLSYSHPEARVVGGKTLFELMDEADTFQYAMLSNKETFFPVIRYLHQHPDFYLVYADPVSSLFVRRTKEHLPILREFAFRKGKVDPYRGYSQWPTPQWAKVVSQLFWPFYKEKDWGRYNVEAERTLYYRLLGDL